MLGDEPICLTAMYARSVLVLNTHTVRTNTYLNISIESPLSGIRPASIRLPTKPNLCRTASITSCKPAATASIRLAWRQHRQPNHHEDIPLNVLWFAHATRTLACEDLPILHRGLVVGFDFSGHLFAKCSCFHSKGFGCDGSTNGKRLSFWITCERGFERFIEFGPESIVMILGVVVYGSGPAGFGKKVA
jgi:hypothetical protein